MNIFRKEIFGPVACVAAFADAMDADAVTDFANNCRFGLGAKIWTRDPRATHGLARRIEVGTITINGGATADRHLPFGGFKQSGWGREGARGEMLDFTEIKSVSIGF